MQPAAQPFTCAQQPLAAHWQTFYESPLRLSRWLTQEADRPLLHDYLLSLSAGPDAPLRRLPPGGAWPPQGTTSGNMPVVWLEQPGGPEAERQLRAHLAGSHPLRLLVLEDAATQPWHRLARWFPAAVHTCTPAVSMGQVLTELRHAAPADEPTGHFQRCFHALTEAIARADSPGVVAHVAACLAAGAALPGPGPVVTTWLAAGQYFLTRQQADEAGRQFAGALACAEASFAAGHAAAGLLSLQAWLGQAAVGRQRRRRQATLVALQQAVNRAEQLPPSLLGVEAARQLGDALNLDGQLRPALASYAQGLRLAEQLPAGQRSGSPVRMLGEAYLNCRQAAPEQQALRRRLAQLLA